MKRSLLIWATVLALNAGAALAGPLEDGFAAEQHGDYSEAVKGYRAAAAQGNATAQTLLGSMYDTGQGVGRDYAEAVKWFQLAAARGWAPAESGLAAMYETGRGVARDYAEAAKWYRLAAAQGFAEAQFNLGVLYYNGQGVAQNFVRSYMWFNLSAASGIDSGPRYRDIVAGRMTPGKVLEAQELARECQQRNFKGCD
jgi:TPR repeat protein